MPVIYRTDDATRWGTGKGANLTPVEVDGNFWDLAERMVALETGGASPNGIANIAVTGSQMTVYLDDGTALGPYTLPTAMIRYRGDWVSGAAYAELDLVAVADVGIYLVLRDHTAAATFDASATDADGNPLYRWLFPIGAGAIRLGELDDVDLATAAPTDGQALVWDSFNGVWMPGDAAGVGAISDLGDVNVWLPEDGQVLTWVAEQSLWKNVALPLSAAHRWRMVVQETFAAGTWLSIVEMEFRATAGVAQTNTDATPFVDPDTNWGDTKRLFDGDLVSYCSAEAPVAGVTYAGGGFPTYREPAEFAIKVYNSTLNDFDIQHSTDGVVWETVATVRGAGITAGTSAGAWYTFALAAPAQEAATAFTGLTDTPAALGTAGQVVAVNADATALEFVAPGSGGAGALDDLSDVTLTTPAVANILQYDGAGWVNSPLAWGEIPDKPATFPPDAHTHITADITGFAEAVDDRVAALLVAGANITLAYDDVAGTLTIDASGGGGAATFLDLTDTPAAFGTAGQLAAVNGTGDGLVFSDPPSGTGGAGALNDLSDVALTTPATGQLLRYDGTSWINGAVDWSEVGGKPTTFPPDPHTHDWAQVTGRPATIDALPPAIGSAGDVMAVQTDGSIAWEPPGGGGGATTLDGLDDVVITTPAAGQHLRFDGTSWVNGATLWADISDPPATFPPDAHTHPWGEVTGRPATVDALPAAVGAAGTVMKAQVDGSLAFEAEAGGLTDAPADGSTYARKDAVWVSIPIEPDEGAYKYWRVRLISEDQLSGTNSVYLGEIEFRSQAGIAEQATGGTIIGDMGSLSKLFDGVKNATGDGASTDPPYTDRYAGYIFPEAKKVNQIAIFAAKNLQAYVPQRFVIEASHDGVAWDEVARADPSGTYYSYTPYLTTPEVPPDQVDWPNVLNKPATVAALPGPVGTDGQVLEAQADGSIIWAAPGGLADAPADGTFYGRLDGAWSNLPQGAGSGLDADLLDGQEAAAFAQLAAPNVFTGDQTFQSEDGGAGRSPLISFDRLSPTPVAGDALAEHRFHANDSNLAKQAAAAIRAVLDDPAAGALSGNLSLLTQRAGVFATRFFVGAGLHSFGASGGDMGADTINAQNLYVDGDQLTYERGSWTPVVTGGSYSGTVSDASGWYSRIGNVVHVGGQINGTDLQFTDDTKYMTCGGLPFSVLNYEAPGTWTGNAISGLHGAVRPTSTTTFYLMGANKTYIDTRLLFQIIYTAVAL